MSVKIQALVDAFAALATWEDRYKLIIEKGKTLAPLEDKFKTEDNKIKGCQSQVWLVAELSSNGSILFKADSDAMIVKGLVAILLEVYSGLRPDEILAISPNFIKSLGFDSHLSPSRANGLHSMIKQIFNYAIAYQALSQAKR